MYKIQVSRPVLIGHEKQYVNECLDEVDLSTGKWTARLEDAFGKWLGRGYCLSTTSGTTALHLGLKALRVGLGDEVIVPALTYVSTANAVAYCGATVVVADVDPDTWCISPEQIERRITRRTVGIIPVHLYGQPCDMDAIWDIASANNLWVFEDACEAHGARYNDCLVGSISDGAAFSFYGNKILATGEGGMLVLDREGANKARYLRSVAQSSLHRYYHDEIGYNYVMPDVVAAIALGQLEAIEWHLAARRRVRGMYDQMLKKEIVRQGTYPNTRSANWMVAVDCMIDYKADELMSTLANARIETRPMFTPINELPMYKSHTAIVGGMLAPRIVCLPTHAGLSESDVEEVCKWVNRVL